MNFLFLIKVIKLSSSYNIIQIYQNSLKKFRFDIDSKIKIMFSNII